MKRKILKDEECMSGTGWVLASTTFECPNCGEEINLFKIPSATKCNCPKCNYYVHIEYGVQYLMRVS